MSKTAERLDRIEDLLQDICYLVADNYTRTRKDALSPRRMLYKWEKIRSNTTKIYPQKVALTAIDEAMKAAEFADLMQKAMKNSYFREWLKELKDKTNE